jgi:hypothetical protein
LCKSAQSKCLHLNWLKLLAHFTKFKVRFGADATDIFIYKTSEIINGQTKVKRQYCFGIFTYIERVWKQGGLMSLWKNRPNAFFVKMNTNIVPC